MWNRSKNLYYKNRPAWIACCLAFMVLWAALFVYVPKAFTAEPTNTTQSRLMCTRNPDSSCAVTPKQAVRMFKAGHYTKAHGIPWNRVTTHPRAVKSVLRAKFARYYSNASGAKKKAIREKYGLRFNARTGESCSFGWGMALCAAKNMVGSLNQVSCTSSDPYANTGAQTCVTITGILGLHHGNGLTKDQVQKNGTVAWCAAGATIAVRSAGTPQGAILVGGVGAGTCMWSVWTLFDS